MPVTIRAGPIAPKRHLREVGVSERTRKVYVLAVRRFFQYLSAERLPLPSTFDQLDEFMAEFVNSLYQDDYPLAQAGHTLSGIQRFFPPCRRRLPTAWQFYNNWQRSRIPRRAVPLPRDVMLAMVSVAAALERWDLVLSLVI
eukprot:1419354-Amphidinium_carterae.1